MGLQLNKNSAAEILYRVLIYFRWWFCTYSGEDCGVACCVAYIGLQLVAWCLVDKNIQTERCHNVVLFCRVNAQHQFLSIKIIKQNVVITSCCNIVLFCHVNAQHQILSVTKIKLSDAVLSCCFVVLFCRVNAQHQVLNQNNQTERCHNVVL